MLLIYLLALGFLLYHVVYSKQSGDRIESELPAFRDIVSTGRILAGNRISVSSCLTVTWLPYIISRITRLNPGWVFILLPCFFFALMPMFVFMIASLYLDVWGAVLAVLMVCANFYFIVEPNNGRIGVGLGFLAGLVWSILTGNLIMACVFVTLISFSHYGTLAYTGCLLAGYTLIMVIFGGGFLLPVVTLGVLIANFLIWHMALNSWSYNIVKQVAVGSITGKSRAVDYKILRTVMARQGIKLTMESYPIMSSGSWLENMMTLDSRDEVVSSALGKGIKTWPLFRIVKLVSYWLVIGLMLYGVGMAFINQTFPVEVLALLFICLMSVIISVVIPMVSVAVGVIRVLFTASIILSLAFASTNYILGYLIILLQLFTFLDMRKVRIFLFDAWENIRFATSVAGFLVIMPFFLIYLIVKNEAL